MSHPLQTTSPELIFPPSPTEETRAPACVLFPANLKLAVISFLQLCSNAALAQGGSHDIDHWHRRLPLPLTTQCNTRSTWWGRGDGDKQKQACARCPAGSPRAPGEGSPPTRPQSAALLSLLLNPPRSSRCGTGRGGEGLNTAPDGQAWGLISLEGKEAAVVGRGCLRSWAARKAGCVRAAKRCPFAQPRSRELSALSQGGKSPCKARSLRCLERTRRKFFPPRTMCPAAATAPPAAWSLSAGAGQFQDPFPCPAARPTGTVLWWEGFVWAGSLCQQPPSSS